VKRYLLRHGLILLATVIAALVLSLFLVRSPLALFRDPLPSYDAVPPFALTERNGQTVTNRDLLGKIWVADFIYTTCPGPCLDLTRHFAERQKEFLSGPDHRLVSFTVDPASDTPEALRTYAQQFGADPDRWLFLTGDKAALYDLFEKGFHIIVTENDDPKTSAEGKFIHTTKLMLIDRRGVIRGYYDGLLPEAQNKLRSDLNRLNRE
jgi:protein SCO1/2